MSFSIIYVKQWHQAPVLAVQVAVAPSLHPQAGGQVSAGHLARTAQGAVPAPAHGHVLIPGILNMIDTR